VKHDETIVPPHAWKQATPHARTDAETRASCLDARGVSDAGTG